MKGRWTCGAGQPQARRGEEEGRLGNAAESSTKQAAGVCPNVVRIGWMDSMDGLIWWWFCLVPVAG